MDSKAQITIETLIIMGAILMIIVTVSIPAALQSSSYAKDVQHAGDARYAVEQIAAVANSLSTSSEFREIRVYIPGYNSQRQKRITEIRATPDGDGMLVKLYLLKYGSGGALVSNESYNFTVRLYGSGWKVYNGTSGAEGITEPYGSWYDVVIRPKNITFIRR